MSTIHVVRIGETLAGLSKAYYGDARLLGNIWEANRESIENPNVIYPGQKLAIPEYPVRTPDVAIVGYDQQVQ